MSRPRRPPRRPHGHDTSTGIDDHSSALLPPVSLLDCIVFCVCLAPQLLLQAGLWATLKCILRALPFLVFQLPLAVARSQVLGRLPRYRSPSSHTSPSVFEDLVLRCVRWAFVNVEPRVGRTFFSRPVALPFLRFRQYRQAGVVRLCRGILLYCLSLLSLSSTSSLPSPSSTTALRWREHHDENFRGLWITYDTSQPPDVVVFFVHGGGFVLGSSYFYLEFLLAWASFLLGSKPSGEKARHFHNPAIFSLDYTLAPDAVFPAQLNEATHAYAHVLSTAARGDPTRVVVAGDSAGGAIVLSLLLRIAQSDGTTARREQNWDTNTQEKDDIGLLPKPAFAVLISPWVSLWSHRYFQSRNDYLDVATLGDYAAQYVGEAAAASATEQTAARPPASKAEAAVDPLLSPGNCQDGSWWRRASPSSGTLVTYGEEEVFAPEIREWAAGLQEAGVDVQVSVDGGLGVHAWPVAALFLARSDSRRFEGLRRIAEVIKERVH